MPMRRMLASLPPARHGLLILPLLLAGCLPEAVTRQGGRVADLYTLFMLAAAVVFAVVVGLLGWSIWRYRGGPRDTELPPQTHGNLRLETAWWALPALLVVVLGTLTTLVLGDVDARADEPDLVVEVTGFQWQWRFTYPDSGVVVTGTHEQPPVIYLPTSETIAFEITARDVIHSFTIPAFLIKRDAVPGRENRFDIVIEDEGTYSGQCGEFCGLLHSYQRFTIEAVPRAEFEAWLAGQQETAANGDG
jgi:cytochrome c oxidase subunit II